MTSMAASTKKVHLPIPHGAPGGPESIFADPPLFCGKVGDYKTPYTRTPHLATCTQCIEKHSRYHEEVEYQRAMAKRAREREQEPE
jgi:hypothetical protein